MSEFILAGLISFAISFVYIFLKATQQLNVMNHRMKPVVPVSMGMAFCEVTVITLVVKTSIWAFIPIGLGGGLGCLLSMHMFGGKRG